jgi:hypothetical protein
MSSHLGTILSFVASLAIVTPILKYLFLSSYRTHLRRSKYVEKRTIKGDKYDFTRCACNLGFGSCPYINYL